MVQHEQTSEKPFDFLLKNGNVRGLKEEERRECEFNLLISNEF